MNDLESIFRKNAAQLDSALEIALKHLSDLPLRIEDVGVSKYNYHDHHLSWSKRLVQDKEISPEIHRVTVSLRYEEPPTTCESPVIQTSVVAEIFQSGSASRARCEFTDTEEITDQTLKQLPLFIRSKFDQGWEALSARH